MEESEPRRCRECASCWVNANMILNCDDEFWSGLKISNKLKLTQFLIIEKMAETCPQYEKNPGTALGLVKRAMGEKYWP